MAYYQCKQLLHLTDTGQQFVSEASVWGIKETKMNVGLGTTAKWTNKPSSFVMLSAAM